MTTAATAPTATVPIAQACVTALAAENPHARDARVAFEEVEHVYTIDGDPGLAYTSVTTFLKKTYFEEFDADAVIERMMASPKWSQSQYHGMTAAQIKDQWHANGVQSADQGTRLHAAIEAYYNGVSIDPDDPHLHDIQPEFHRMFRAFHDEYVVPRGYTPYRTEWCVFDESLRLAGSIDMVYRRRQPDAGAGSDADADADADDDDEELLIYDWKRTKKLSKTNPFACCRGVLSGLPDSNYWHYALQLNMYRWILQKNYGKRVARLALVVLHPSNDSYQVVPLPLLDDLVEKIVEARLEDARTR